MGPNLSLSKNVLLKVIAIQRWSSPNSFFHVTSKQFELPFTNLLRSMVDVSSLNDASFVDHYVPGVYFVFRALCIYYCIFLIIRNIMHFIDNLLNEYALRSTNERHKLFKRHSVYCFKLFCLITNCSNSLNHRLCISLSAALIARLVLNACSSHNVICKFLARWCRTLLVFQIGITVLLSNKFIIETKWMTETQLYWHVSSTKLKIWY